MNRLKSPLLLIFLASVPIKFAAAQNMPFDIDIVPVLQRNLQYLLSPVGTLSSVAAYNMSMLEWMHLPAFWLTGNAWWTIFLTLILFNLLGTIAVFKLSEAFFGKGAAYATAALFTFSEVGISSTYTAWAQLLLPSYFALLLCCLWLWHTKEKGQYLALSGIIATAAFMTHFSAILLYPAMLAFALLNRSKWQWRWLFVGGLACFLMLAPYLYFEIGRDFRDLRAFLNQDLQVAPEVLEQYRPYANPNQNAENNPAQNAENNNPQNSETPKNSWFDRALAYALSLPMLLFNAIQAAFPTNTRHLGIVGTIVFALPMLLFWLGLPLALWRRDEGARHYGRLALFMGLILFLMALTRTLNDITYLMGFMSVQTIMAGYAISVFLQSEKEKRLTQKSINEDNSRGDPAWSPETLRNSPKNNLPDFVLPQLRQKILLLASLLVLFCGLQIAERAERLLQHDDAAFSAYNVSLYRHISAAVDAIAADWQGGDSLSISYDILPEMPNLWWTPAWNSIDSTYRMGMNFDFLLLWHHGLQNSNQDALGTVTDADYIVIYSPAASRYDLTDYDVWRFGAIWVLKPH